MADDFNPNEVPQESKPQPQEIIQQQEVKKKSSPAIPILIILIILGVVGYGVWQTQSKEKPVNNDSSSSAIATNSEEVSSVAKASSIAKASSVVEEVKFDLRDYVGQFVKKGNTLRDSSEFLITKVSDDELFFTHQAHYSDRFRSITDNTEDGGVLVKFDKNGVGKATFGDDWEFSKSKCTITLKKDGTFKFTTKDEYIKNVCGGTYKPKSVKSKEDKSAQAEENAKLEKEIKEWILQGDYWGYVESSDSNEPYKLLIFNFKKNGKVMYDYNGNVINTTYTIKGDVLNIDGMENWVKLFTNIDGKILHLEGDNILSGEFLLID